VIQGTAVAQTRADEREKVKHGDGGGEMAHSWPRVSVLIVL